MSKNGSDNRPQPYSRPNKNAVNGQKNGSQQDRQPEKNKPAEQSKPKKAEKPTPRVPALVGLKHISIFFVLKFLTSFEISYRKV